jgi:hypothetical protein
MLFDAFLLESKWLSTSQIPSLDEYLSNGVTHNGRDPKTTNNTKATIGTNKESQ